MARRDDPAVDRTLPEPRSGPDDWRIEQYQRMGFTWAEAVELSRAKDRNGVVVWWRRVEDALAAGLTDVQCLELFCTHLD